MQEAGREEGKKDEVTGPGWQWGQKKVGYRRIRQWQLTDGAETQYDSYGSTQGEAHRNIQVTQGFPF